MERSEGFPPIARADARILILGSLPSRRSLAEQQYYAHPQNAFWRIMREALGVQGDYAQRCAALIERRIAVWDVLGSSVRPGSMDADIQEESAEVNDFNSFFEDCADIRRVLCNGAKAHDLFRRLVLPELVDPPAVLRMPSTSPAYASMRFDVKLRKWQDALAM